MKIQNTKMRFLLLALTLCFPALAARAQTTVFTYQGRFIDSTAAQPTNGTYNMQFKLFTTAQINSGTQIGDTQTVPAMQVVNGIFTVQLDAENSFNGGADLFVEIGVRPAGSGAVFTVLAPRQQVTSAPYAVQSRNALTALTAVNSDKLGNIPASNYTQNTDTRLSDDRNPLAGSANYIQNTNSPQSSANFNVSGNGTAGGTLSANVVNSATNYKIGGATVFSTPNASSVVVGQSSNHALTADFNSFFGAQAGQSNTSGFSNTFIGNSAGRLNLDGNFNVFAGKQAGENNTSGSNNVFTGFAAGLGNKDGSRNSFFGDSAGLQNESGDDNSFFGNQAGVRNTVSENSFFGAQAGLFNRTGIYNSFFGFQAGRAMDSGFANSFFGYQAGNNATGARNTFVGTLSGFTTTGGNNNTLIGFEATTGGAVNNSTAIGANANVTTSNTIVLGTNTETTQIPGAFSVAGKAKIITLGAAGSTSLCRNAANEISTCTPGNFAENGEKSAAFSALNQQNLEMKTQLERQQKQINEQSEKNKQLQTQIDDLRKLFCGLNPAATVCTQ